MEMETFIRCAAARPRDANGNILLSDEPLYKQFKDHNELFSHTFFSSDEFQEVAKLIAAAECAEASKGDMQCAKAFEGDTQCPSTQHSSLP